MIFLGLKRVTLKLKMDKIITRQMQQADIPVAMKLKEAEGWNQTEADWALLLSHNPELCLVAETGGEVAGTVTAINFENKVAWIGMMLVSKSHRGKGLSKLLLNTIIKQLDACKSIKLDATPAGKKVYDKLGFVDEYGIARMTTQNLVQPTNNDAAMEPKELTPAKLNEIILYDKKAFGVNREKVLDFLLKNQTEKAWYLEENGEITGYILSRPGCNFTQVGPVVANTLNNAKALLFSVLNKMEGQPVVVDVMEEHKELIAWLEGLNFTVQRSFRRMYLKANPFAGNPSQQVLIAGPELG